MTIVRKTATSEANGMEFVLSDASIDRYGDVIVAEGWDLKNFANNPVALFNHNPDFPIGKWENLRVEKGALRGHLKLAPEGISQRIDEIRGLMAAGVLRAVSVGFRALEAEPRGGGGMNYKRSELVETSLVSVPANPNALAVAKAMKISDETMKMVFAKDGKGDIVTRASATARTPHATPSIGNRTMTPLSVRIEQSQARLVALQDELQKHLDTIDDANPTDDQTAITETFNKQIETQQRSLDALKAAESRVAAVAGGQPPAAPVTRANANGGGFGVNLLQPPPPAIIAPPVPADGRVFATAAKKVQPFDFLVRAALVQFKHACQKSGNLSAIDILKAEYGECDRTFHMYNVITRAASAPAMTSTSGWADTFVQTVIDSMIETLTPGAIYPRLASMGRRYTFGRNGTISIPARTVANAVGGAFVLQGNPIPVKQGAFSAVTLGPKKMGVITTLTREMAEHSTPALETILRDAMLEDTAVALDTVLTDATAISTTRPPGLKNGVSKVNASTSTVPLTAFVADIQGLAAALTTNTLGNIRNPVWIMNPSDVLKAKMLQTTTGDFVFRDELNGGTLLGYPVIQSTVGTSDVMFLIDAADFATATGDAPRMDVSDQAVLHMEDTSPAALSAVGTPNTVAAPLRSLYQTDTMAIRLIMDVNWVMVRTGTVQWTDTMAWN